MKRLLLDHHQKTIARSLLRRSSRGGAGAAAARVWTTSTTSNPKRSFAGGGASTSPPPPPPPPPPPTKKADDADADDFSSLYRIEVSNADRRDATKLTVSGPDVDGIIASMTLSLAREGCSVVELHAQNNATTSSPAGNSLKEPDMLASRTVTDDYQIEDVFFVVDRATGTQFADHRLRPLAEALLRSLKFPLLPVLSGGAGAEKLRQKNNRGSSKSSAGGGDDDDGNHPASQIRIVQSFEMPDGSGGGGE